jgi:hypothetical protein
MKVKKLASCPDRFNTMEKAPGTHRTEDWLDPKAGLNLAEKRKFSYPYCKSNLVSSTVQHLAPTYINCVILSNSAHC